jgi:serine/threonine protein kinase
MLRAGDRIGPYTLIKKLGGGAFGMVWLAENRTAIATTQMAIKLPISDDFDMEVVKQEANLWVRASGHPNILPIIEANIYDGQVVIVSEYAPDGSLASWLKQQKKISIEQAVEITCGILAGLGHLHSKLIIHRDLKPENILLQGETPRLADFGIARVIKSNSLSTIAAGTPMYMSPEAFCGKRNVQTDLWSVGIIFYLLLTGYAPFPQKNLVSLIKAVTELPPRPLSRNVPAALQEILLRALDKDPNCRYRSAPEMIVALRSAYAGSKLEFFNPDTSILAPNMTAMIEDEADFIHEFTALIDSDQPSSADFIIELPSTSDSTTFAAQPPAAASTIISYENLLADSEELENFHTAKTELPTHQEQQNFSAASLPSNSDDSEAEQPADYDQIDAQVVTASSTIDLNLLKLENYQLPRKIYLGIGIACLVAVAGAAMKSPILKGWQKTNSLGALKVATTVKMKMLFSDDMQDQAETAKTAALVKSTLKDVDETIIRLETEMPCTDPIKEFRLTRFKAFHNTLQSYCKAACYNCEARNYAECAQSQLKVVCYQLDCARAAKTIKIIPGQSNVYPLIANNPENQHRKRRIVN